MSRPGACSPGTSTSGGRPSTTSPTCSRSSPEEEWTTPTDLAGWDVQGGAPRTSRTSRASSPATRRRPPTSASRRTSPGFMGLYTEIGVVNRRDASPTRSSTRSARRPRRGTPRCSPTRPPTATRSPSRSSAASPWDWRTLLRNRPLDVWMHEQDVRRAVGRPGDMDSRAGPAHRGVPRREPRLRARQEGRRTGRHHRWCWTWRAARRSRSTINDDRPRRAARRPPAEPDGDAADGPRVVHPARRRPLRRRARARSRVDGDQELGQQVLDAHGHHPVTGGGRHLAARRHPRPGRPHRRGHRHDRRRARPPHRARAGPPRRPGGARRPQPRSGSTRPRETIRAEVPGRRARAARASTSPTWRRYAARRPRPPRVRPDRRAGQQRRRDGHAVPAHRRRARAADGDQPLRPVPADRAAAAAAGRQRGRHAW